MIYHLAKPMVQHGIYHQKMSIRPKTQPHCFYNQSFHCNGQCVRAAEMCVAPFNVSKHYLPTLSPASNFSFKNSKRNALGVSSFTYRLLLSEETFDMLYLNEKPLQTSLFSDQQGQQVGDKFPKQHANHTYPLSVH